jgi:hypothetical protein
MGVKNKNILRNTFLLIIGIVVLIFIFDFIRISNYKTFPINPENEIQCNESQVYYDLTKGKSISDWNALDGTLEFIKSEYDCSDFRLVNLIRIMYDFDDSIPRSYKNNIEEVLLGFRYWWDEPGENSMCYWSENHQILFASAEYLVGQKYPDRIFSNSGLIGKQHVEKSKKRILDWLEMRWNYGFTEFFSNAYYEEDISALVNLIDYANDKEIVIRCQIIMDLLLYDVASQSCNNMFISASGRAYFYNRKGGDYATLGGVTEYLWGDKSEIGVGTLYGLTQSRKYQLPPVIKEIAKDRNNVIIKQRNGLNIDELEQEGFYGTDTRSMMMQWGMEAFSNFKIVRNSLSHMRSHNMFTNGFISDLKLLDFTLLRYLGLEPLVIKILNPQSNGVAIQKGNTYTYKTKDYSMYTVPVSYTHLTLPTTPYV